MLVGRHVPISCFVLSVTQVSKTPSVIMQANMLAMMSRSDSATKVTNRQHSEHPGSESGVNGSASLAGKTRNLEQMLELVLFIGEKLT